MMSKVAEPLPTERVQPVRGGKLRILGMSDVDYLDPQRAYFTCTYEVLRCLVRSLMTYPGKPRPEGSIPVFDLAEDVHVSEDRRVYTFRLKPARYAPPVQRMIRSTDFLFSFQRMLDPELLPNTHVYLRDIEGVAEVLEGKTDRISGISCPDERTIVIRLTRPLADFLNVMALPMASPTPPEIAIHHKHDYSLHVVATGPYMVASDDGYVPKVRLGLIRNPNWDSALDPIRGAWVDGLDISLNAPGRTILEQIEADEADLPMIASPGPADIERYMGDPRLRARFHADYCGCVHFLSLNTTVPPLDNVKVRLAINYAIDKIGLRAVRGGEVAGEISSTIIPPNLLGHRHYDLYPTPGHRGDPEKARRLLAEAGYPNGFTTWGLIVRDGFGPGKGEAVRQALTRAGIDVEIRAVSAGEFVRDWMTRPDKKVPLGISCGFCPDWPGGGTRTLVSTLFDGRKITPVKTTNFALYNNPTVNALIDRAEVALQEEADELWAEIDRRIMEDAPIVPWIYDNHMTITSSRLRNYFAHPFLVGPDWANVWLAA